MSEKTRVNPEKAVVPFDIQITSSEMAVRDALCSVLSALDPLGLSIEDMAAIELVLAEALNNIVEHAYAPAEKEGPILIRGECSTDGLHIQITDRGKAIPGCHAPPGKAQNVEVALGNLPEGGFGWFLIRGLAKDVHYQRVGDVNQLDLWLAVTIPRKN